MGCGGSIKCEKELFIISLMNFYSCSSRLFICRGGGGGTGRIGLFNDRTKGRRTHCTVATAGWQYCRKEIHCERISVLF